MSSFQPVRMPKSTIWPDINARIKSGVTLGLATGEGCGTCGTCPLWWHYMLGVTWFNSSCCDTKPTLHGILENACFMRYTYTFVFSAPVGCCLGCDNFDRSCTAKIPYKYAHTTKYPQSICSTSWRITSSILASKDMNMTTLSAICISWLNYHIRNHMCASGDM